MLREKKAKLVDDKGVLFILVLMMGVLFVLAISQLLQLSSGETSKKRVGRSLESYLLETASNNEDVSVKVALKARGVETVGKKIGVRLRIFDKNEQIIDVLSMFTSLGDELLESSGFDFSDKLVIGRQYVALVKGEKHRQAKINFIFDGEKIDLTTKLLLPGDLPWNNGVQDKVVDRRDYDAVIKRIGSSNVDDLKIADVDFNGKINDLDRSLVLATLTGR